MLFFTLIIQSTDNCIKLLKYLDKNIQLINKIGVGVNIKKYDEENVSEPMSKLIQKKNITRLPALITNQGDIFIGLDDIINIFNKNLNKFKETQDEVNGCDFGSNDYLSNMYKKEMLSEIADKKGKLIPRRDEDENINEDIDFRGQMARFNKVRGVEMDTGEFNNSSNKNDNNDDDDDNIISKPAPRQSIKQRPIASQQPIASQGSMEDGEDLINLWLANNASSGI